MFTTSGAAFELSVDSIIFHTAQNKVTVAKNLKTNKTKQFTKGYTKVNTEYSVSNSTWKSSFRHF